MRAVPWSLLVASCFCVGCVLFIVCCVMCVVRCALSVVC